MDPFDEFQFKPLTDGLGFHKKPATLKDQVKHSGLADEHLQELPTSIPRFSEDVTSRRSMTFDDVISSLEKPAFKPSMPGKSFLEITEPLPRSRDAVKTMDVDLPKAQVQSPFPSQDLFRQPPPPAPATIKKTPSYKDMSKVGTRRGAADSPHGRLIATNASLPSALLDAVVVTAMTLIFLAALLSITKTDLGFVLRTLDSDSWILAGMILMVLAIVQIYVIISRTFYGRTLGEWTFDVQLGRDEDHRDAMYPIRVAGRSLLVTGTGLVVLPLLSVLFGKDLAGRLTGVQLYQQRF